MEMKNEIKVGIIGCGNIARTKHIPGLKKVEGVILRGFYSFYKSDAQVCCDTYGCKDSIVYDSVEQMLADQSIDVVHICTPNNTHAELALMALQANKHVMVEKPMAISSNDAANLADCARRMGLKLTVGHQHRFREDSQQLYRMVQAGMLGEIYYAKAHAIRRRGVPSWGSFLNKSIQGGGPLIDIGCHALDLTLWLMDNYKPKMVVGTTYQKLGHQKGLTNSWGPWDTERFEVEDSAFGFITMENGATLSLETSWALNSLDTSNITSRLCGTLGGADMCDGLRVNLDQHGILQTIYPLASNNFEFPPKQVLIPGDLEMASWIQALRTDSDPVVKADQVAVVIKLIEAIYKSAALGKPVYL